MNAYRWSKLFGAVSITLALGALAGCQKPTDAEDTEAVVPELAQEPAAEKPARGPHARPERGAPKHGPAFLLGAALHKLDLTDAQRTAIQTEIDALREAREAHTDRDAAHAALAAAVRSGNIDEAALVSQLAPKAPDTARVAKAIGVLYNTLTRAQRKELVADVEAHQGRGPMGHHGPDVDHESEGRGADADLDDARPRGKGHGGHGARGPREHGPLAHMLRDLSLSDAQRDKVKEALAKLAPSESEREAAKAHHEAMQKEMRERLATFASDSFDATAFVAPPAKGAGFGPDKMFGSMVKALAAVVPILDDAQRAELAKHIEEGPAGPKKGKGRHAE